jgi:hypothetical protein
MVRVDLDDGAILMLNAFAAEADLVLDRGGRLKVG